MNRSQFVDLLVKSGVLIAALIPTWIYLGLWSLMGPEGFWQVLAMLAVGAVVFLGMQVVLLIAYVALVLGNDNIPIPSFLERFKRA